MMQVNGFEMYDLGVDASPMNLVAKAEEVNADLLCLSGLMMPSMPFMRETIELAKANPVLKDHIKIMVGGGPVTEQWAGDNGADGYADDAMGAVKKAYELLAI
jgi:trimethylamine corrinoid protein